MKRLLTIFAALFYVQAFSQVSNKIIFEDACEQIPVIPCSWCTSKYDGWTAFTAGFQNLQDQSGQPGHTLKALASGEEGAPAPRKGSKSYQMKITRMPEYFGSCCEWTRNELKWGNGCTEGTDTRWYQASMLVPSDFCEDVVPVGVLWDMKFGDAIGPASFGMKIEDGKYIVSQMACHSCPQTFTELQIPLYKGQWVDWLVERNHKDDGSGFINLYYHVPGVHSGYQLIYSHTGPNFMMQCGPTSESYLQQGLYKWAWQDANNQGEGPSIPCGYETITMYYDEFRFWTSQATLADLNASIAGTTGGNLSPTVNAGTNQTITLPTSTANLNATASDADGTITTYAWTKVSGPAGGTISDATIEDPSLSALQEGTYVYRITVTDDDGAQAVDDVQIIVQTAPTVAIPSFTDIGGTVTPTPDRTVFLPKSADTITFFATDNNNGYIQVMHAVQLTGPNTSTVNEYEQGGWRPSYMKAGITGLIEGVYTYRLEATDNDANTAYDTITVTVVSADNDPPTVDAGTYQVLQLNGTGAFNTTTTTLIGTASDADGSIASVGWAVLSGPENSSFCNASNDTTCISGLIGGKYIVQFYATDNSGATSYDTLSVTVLTCNAGADQVITLPSAATLSGTCINVSDTASVSWTKISGTGGTIASPNSLSTTVSGLSVGTYVYELAVTYNNGYTVVDRVTLTVLSPTKYYKIERN